MVTSFLLDPSIQLFIKTPKAFYLQLAGNRLVAVQNLNGRNHRLGSEVLQGLRVLSQKGDEVALKVLKRINALQKDTQILPRKRRNHDLKELFDDWTCQVSGDIKSMQVADRLRGTVDEDETSLDLTQLKAYFLPKIVAEFTHLLVLNLSFNEFRLFPKEIECLKQLKELYLSHNRITDLSEKIGVLKDLKVLDVSHNRLLDLPEALGNLSHLEHLNVSNNDLTKLPERIGELRNLKVALFNSNCLEKIPLSFSQLSSLEEISFKKNCFQSFPTWMVDFRKTLQEKISIIFAENGFQNHTKHLIEIHQGEVSKDPLRFLKIIAMVSQVGVTPKPIEISLVDMDKTIDQGGVFRQILNELFKGLVSTHYFKFEDAYYIPFCTSFNPEISEVYQAIGAIFAYCFFYKEFPIGYFFDESLFAVILNFSEEIKKDFSEFSLQDLAKFQTDRKIHQYVNQLDLQEMNETLDLYYENLGGDSRSSSYKKIEELSAHFREILTPILLPIFHIAKGFYTSKYRPLQSSQYHAGYLSNVIQGELNTEDFLERINYGLISDIHQEWIKKWIKELPRPRLDKFIQMVTGSSAIPYGKRISIYHDRVEKFKFNTCALTFYIPFQLFGLYETFREALTSIVEAELDFNEA